MGYLTDYKPIPWTREEIKILRRDYPQNGAEILGLLKRHTKSAITQRAIKLKIGFTDERKRWYVGNKKIIPRDIKITPDKKLDRNYYKITFCTDCYQKEENEFLKNRINKRYGLNFRVTKFRKTFRIENSRHADIQRFLFLISPYKIKWFNYKWGALYDPKFEISRKLWSKSDDDILRKKYPRYGSNISQLKRRGRSKIGIRGRANTLGIKCTSCFWNKEQEGILVEKYPEFGTNIPELLEQGFTTSSIKGKAKLMGIKCNYYFNQSGKYIRT